MSIYNNSPSIRGAALEGYTTRKIIVSALHFDRTKFLVHLLWNHKLVVFTIALRTFLHLNLKNQKSLTIPNLEKK